MKYENILSWIALGVSAVAVILNAIFTFCH